jgi:glycine betaine/proline transport system permease protein
MFTEFPESATIPLGDWVDRFVRWVLATFTGVFDAMASVMRWMVLNLESVLLAIPWPVFLLVVAIGAWFSTRSKLTTVVLVALTFMIGTFQLWDLTMITLSIIITAAIISIVIGLPLGIIIARNPTVEAVAKPVLDGMQTMPAFVYLIPAVMFFGLGVVPAVFASVIYAVPPLIRLTELGIRGVSEPAIEAATAYGASPMQVLKDVQLPLALPGIMAGLNQMTMMALAMVVISSMIGARGVGQEVLVAIGRVDIGRGAEAGLAIVALAIVIDRITQGFARRYEESIS